MMLKPRPQAGGFREELERHKLHHSGALRNNTMMNFADSLQEYSDKLVPRKLIEERLCHHMSLSV